MTSPRQKAQGPAHRWMGLTLGAAIVACPGLTTAATAVDLFYERTVMSAAGARCALFSPTVEAALAAGRAQARGAALRAGVAETVLEEVQRRAFNKAAAEACGSPGMSIAAGRVRDAFEGYARLIRMNYPGDVSAWRADRSTSRQQPVWRLSQGAEFGADRMIFGLAGHQAPGALVAAVSFEDGKVPYAARLVMRDKTRAPLPYLDARTPGPDAPPRSAARVFAAERRAPAEEALLPVGAKFGWAFRFPAQAARTMEGLDPREAVAVEFVFSGSRGDVVRRANVEVGDFAAGRAFLQAAQR